MAQLNAYARTHGMEIETVPIRGNVDTASDTSAAVNWTPSYWPPPG